MNKLGFGFLRIPKAEDVLQAVRPGASMASHALRFAMSLPGVEVVLSGMNDLTQVQDNLQDFDPLTPQDKVALEQASKILNSSIAVGCTGCGYCLKHCPKSIPIPDYFQLYNELMRRPGDGWKITPTYNGLTQQHTPASGCVECGLCEQNCPQKLPIREHLKAIRAAMEKA